MRERAPFRCMPMGRAVDDPEAARQLEATRRKVAEGEGLSLADAMRTGAAEAESRTADEKRVNTEPPG